jgi:hypothetical protein
LPFDKGGAVAQRTVTIVIDEEGNSEIDLDGFADNSCAKIFEDFRGRDKVKTERKKAAFYTSQPVDKRTITGR